MRDLVGREAELRAACRAWEAGSGGLLLLGEPGVGKTALARAFVAERRLNDATWVYGTSGKHSIPFGDLVWLLPREDHPYDGPGAELMIAERLCKQLSAAPDGPPPTVVVDDVHLLDDASAALLMRLCAVGQLRLVLTARSGEAVPDPVTALWKDGHVEQLDVTPLEQASAHDLIARLLARGAPAAVERATLLRLARVAGGNPLFLRELVASGLASGRLAKRYGVWGWEGDLVTGAERLSAVLEERFSRMTPAAREALQLTAVAEQVALDVLIEASSHDAVAAAEAEGVVVVEGDDQGSLQCRPTHPMYGEVVRATLPVLRRREICGALADGVGDAPPALSADLLQWVVWRLEAGRTPEPDVALRAAWHAAVAQSMELAERCARAALRHRGGTEAQYLLASVLHRAGRHEEAIAVLDESRREMVGTTGTGAPASDAVVRLDLLRARVTFAGLNDPVEAARILDRAAATASTPEARARIAGVRAVQAVHHGLPLDAIEHGSPVASDDTVDATARVAARYGLAMGLALNGRGAEAIEVAQRTLAEPTSDFEASELVGGAAGALMLAFQFRGDAAALQGVAEQTYRRSTLIGHQPAQGGAAITLGLAAMMNGDIEVAIRHLREGQAVLHRADTIGARVAASGYLAVALALAGDVRGAEEAAEEAADHMPRGTAGFRPIARLGAAWASAAGGHHATAVERLTELAADCEKDGMGGYALLARHALVQLGETDQVEPMTRMAQGMDGRLIELAVAHAGALAAGDAAALGDLVDHYLTEGRRLDAVFSASQAAAVSARRGDSRRARRMAATTAELLARCPGARPPLVPVTAAQLTRRERQVADLAAAMTTPQIAAELRLSPRTVETHLHNAFAKLGVSDRRELAAVLRPGNVSGS